MKKIKIVVSLVGRPVVTATNTIKDMARENGFDVHDALVTENLNLILLDGTLDFATQISKLNSVESIDVQPKITLF